MNVRIGFWWILVILLNSTLQASFAHSSHLCVFRFHAFCWDWSSFAFNYYGQFDLTSTIILSGFLRAFMAETLRRKEQQEERSTVQTHRHTFVFINEKKCKIRTANIVEEEREEKNRIRLHRLNGAKAHVSQNVLVHLICSFPSCFIIRWFERFLLFHIFPFWIYLRVCFFFFFSISPIYTTAFCIQTFTFLLRLRWTYMPWIIFKYV